MTAMCLVRDCPACRSMNLREKFVSGDDGALEIVYVCRDCGDVSAEDDAWHEVPETAACEACAHGEHEMPAMDCECPCHGETPARKPPAPAIAARARRAA